MKYIIFFIIIKDIISQIPNICNPEKECLSCNKIWESEGYNPCLFEFFNGFCYNSTITAYSHNEYFITKYEDHKCPILENSLCGKSDITEEINDENFYDFLSFDDPKYLEKNNLLCHYTFKNNDEKDKEDLIIEIELNLLIKNNNNANNGRNTMFIFVQESNAKNTKNAYRINLNEFLNKKFTIKIAEFKSISIYVSLIKNNGFIDNYKIEHLHLGVKKDNTKSQNAKRYKYAILIICLLCILCVGSCFILYLVKYKRNRELINQRVIGMMNNMDELNNQIDPAEKKNKLEKLFKDKLKKRKYLKKLNINATTACSICLEEFIENESIVCITPCIHIFHYNCLHDWLFTENSNCSCPYCNYNLLSKEPPQKRYINKNKNKKDDIEKIDNEKPNNNDFHTSERIIKKRRRTNDNNNNNINEDKKIIKEKDINNINNINNINKIDNIEDSKNVEKKTNSNTQGQLKSKDQPKKEEEDNDNDISFGNNGHNAKQKREENNNSNNNKNEENNNNIIINNENDIEKEDDNNINNDNNENILKKNENDGNENKNN